MIGALGILVMLILLFLRVPVALCMGIVGFVGYWLVAGLNPALHLMGILPYSVLSNYTFTVVPLFILMGFFMFYGQIANGMFNAFNKWLSNIPGGICYATILGGAAFGAANGGGPASTATLSKIAIPEMTRLGVDRKLAYGVVASAGPLAVMIPPSLLMIIYAIWAEQSVSKLLIAGVVPGIIISLGYMLTVFVLTKRYPQLAPKVEKTPFKEKVQSLKGVWEIAVLIVAILGGLYLGFFTPTEAGAIGAFVALIVGLITRKLNLKAFNQSVYETIKTCGMIFFLVCSSLLFGSFMSITQLSVVVSDFLVSLDVHPMVLMIAICIMYLILGCFIDMFSALVITLPIILPTVEGLGFDLIWFGVILVFICEISLVTPPFGMSLFVIKSTVPDGSIGEIIRGSVPFIVADLLILLFFLFFPGVVLFLPNMM